jgi:hypothetical protein
MLLSCPIPGKSRQWQNEYTKLEAPSALTHGPWS